MARIQAHLNMKAAERFPIANYLNLQMRIL
jgi:hypothetical protein